MTKPMDTVNVYGESVGNFARQASAGFIGGALLTGCLLERVGTQTNIAPLRWAGKGWLKTAGKVMEVARLD